jgi:hypothetical protein
MEDVMRLSVTIAALLLTGCAAQVVPHVARTDVQNPKSVVEEALMSQEEDRRPVSVKTTDEYVEYGGETTTTVNAIVLKKHDHQKVTRMYWRAVADSKVYTKRGNVVVQFRNAQGTLLSQVVMDSVPAGERLVDAVGTLKAGSGAVLHGNNTGSGQ